MSYSTQVNINVPFSWEHKPGVSKVTNQEEEDNTASTTIDDVWHLMVKTRSLPPPPCPSFDESHSHIIPLISPSNYRGSFKKKGPTGYYYRYQEDPNPFLVAYKKCTDEDDDDHHQYPVINGKIEGRKKNRRQIGATNFSCKHSCVVASDNLVRMSQIHRPIMKGKELIRN